MSNNRDLSNVLESLKDLEEKTASTKEISVLRELLAVTITSVLEIAEQTKIISTALQKQNQLINEKADLNRKAIDKIMKTLLKIK